MNMRSAEHLESAFDFFWGAPALVARLQIEMVVASMTVGIGFWSLWHTSRGERAIQAIEESHDGRRSVIRVKFRR
jgi:hypothetical protein